jgi:hypothetical protein
MISVLPRLILACVALAVLVGALSGCAGFRGRGFGDNRDERSNVYPENFKAELLAFLHSYLNDPTNVRDASIAAPTTKTVGSQNRYVACVRFNAKNSDGKYIGSKVGMAIYTRGRFDRFVDQAKEQCSDADFKPFPELEARGNR